MNYKKFNRYIRCGGWFKWVLQHLSPSCVADCLKPKGLEDYRMLAVDASVVNSGVSKFSKPWRLHFSLDIFALTSHEVKLANVDTGETLLNFMASKGDLFLGDRAYASKKGISHCLRNGADFILRLRFEAFSVHSESGEKLDLLALLESAGENDAVDIPVFLDLSGYGLGTRQVRVCALKKSKEAIERTVRRMSMSGNRKLKRASGEAKKFGEHIAVITSLPSSVGADEVLSAYRYRWQVELCFKRLKSLLGAGEIPKKRADCMEAWLNGKMVLAVLFEVLLSKLDFSPLGRCVAGQAQHMEGNVFPSIRS